MGKTRRRSPSSSSNSSGDETHRRRRRCRRLENERSFTPSATGQLQQRRATPSSTETDDKVRKLEELVNSLMAKLAAPAIDGYNRNVKPECVPQFRPGNPSLHSSKWLDKIEQLGALNHWDDGAKIFVMQARLGGVARQWYDNLTSYRHTWQEWKDLIVETFPDHKDFATTLRKMLNYQKGKNDTWEHYYFEKMNLLQGCKIVGRDAVSCIIDGITNSTVQTGARAGRYKTPESLYSEYLSTLQSYRQSTSQEIVDVHHKGYLSDSKGESDE